jgi:hypothetical protein
VIIDRAFLLSRRRQSCGDALLCPYAGCRREAQENLVTARDPITRCGYHKRDEELAELEAVRDGQRRFADLPPRV